MEQEPLRVAVANDHEIIVRGLAAMLGPVEGVEVAELVVNGHELGPDSTPMLDVVLYDTYGRDRIDAPALRKLLDGKFARHVAVFTLSWDAALVQRALDQGVSGVLSKGMTSEQLVDALHRIASGEVVIAQPPVGRSSAGSARDWPGRSLGLSERESEVLVLLAQGLRNADIAKVLFVGDETIKTHVKRAYRKLGVGNRAQATNLVLRHTSFTNG